LSTDPAQLDSGVGNFDTLLFNAFPDPIILLSKAREIVFANQAAIDVLDIKYHGRDLALSLRVPDVLIAADAVLGGELELEIAISLLTPIPHNLNLKIIRIPSPNLDDGPVALMVFHDISSEAMVEQIRQDFVANLSHELRSPIASLIGFIETLQGPAKDDVLARERFLTIMYDESRRMARMIDDLLLLSRVETSEHIRPREQVSINELLGMTRELLSTRAEARSMDFDFDILSNLPLIAGDQDELMQVFQNLIDNAIKYGYEETAVSVRASLIDRIPDIGGTGIAVTIKNKGEGIANDKIPRLTERFYRIDKGRSRKMGGTGLGLAIVKHIISRHRGHFVIKSELGVSATFTIYLPL
jgi:two-component system phosphate regulon sensor histidine kinase PhoR